MRGNHPDVRASQVRCSSCGSQFTVGSTLEALVLDVCSNCHPAYTGIERPVVEGSRIDRFERRRARAALA